MVAPGRRWRAAGAAAALIALVAGFVAGERVAPGDKAHTVSERSPARGPTSLPAAVLSIRDVRGGFRVAYPRSWSRVRATDPAVRLLVSDRRAASLLVRVAPLGFDARSRRIDVLGDLAEQLVRSVRWVRVLAPRQRLQVGDVPGYLYLYGYTDPAGRSWMHWHLILFAGSRLYALVFQAPTAAGERYVAVFDRIAASFRVAPN